VPLKWRHRSADLAGARPPSGSASLQGAFGAILAPAVLGTLITTFRDPRERGRAFGVFGSVAGAGCTVGLILGGFLTQDLSWRWTLYVNLIFAAIAVAGALVFMRGSRPASRPRIGPRLLIASGLLAGAAAMAYLTQLSVTSGYATGGLPALILLGLGFGMILAPAINTATTGVRPQDSGVAFALVNTMQQVGGSIGAPALSTVALTATASYLTAHQASPLALETAAVHGYTVAFTVSAALFALGAVLAFALLPSRAQLAQRRSAAVPDAASAGAVIPAATGMTGGTAAAGPTRETGPAPTTCPASGAAR
jgi:MFS family permease